MSPLTGLVSLSNPGGASVSVDRADLFSGGTHVSFDQISFYFLWGVAPGVSLVGRVSPMTRLTCFLARHVSPLTSSYPGETSVSVD